MSKENKSAAPKKRSVHYGYVIVACCCLMMGINTGATFSCAGIFFKPVSESLGVAVGQLSLYVSLMYITSAVTLLFAGALLERFSARWLFSGSSAVMGVAFVIMACASGLWSFYVAGALLGCTLAFLMYLSFPTLVNRWFKKRVGVMIGICAAASGIGGLVLNPVAGWMIENFGWRFGYGGFAAVILLIVTPLLIIFLRDYPADKGLEPYGADKDADAKSSNGSRMADGVEYQRAIAMPAFYGVALFSFIMMGVSTLNLFVPAFIESNFGLTQASLVAGVVMGGAAVGKVVLGWINDHNSMAGLLVTTLFGIAGLMMFVTCCSSLLLMYIGAFLFGWEYSGVTVQTAMLTKTIFGSRNYARIYSFISIALAAGGALASGGWGMLADASGYELVFWCGAGVLAFGLLIAAWSLISGKRAANRI